MNPPLEQLTAEGYDLQFGTNVLGLYPLSLFPARVSQRDIPFRSLLFHQAVASCSHGRQEDFSGRLRPRHPNVLVRFVFPYH